MKTFTKFMLAGISICLISPLVVMWWALFARDGLPDVESLRIAAPEMHRRVTQTFCAEQYTGDVVPLKEMSPFVLRAFRAAEVPHNHSPLTWRLAMQLNCKPSRRIETRLLEYRLKVRIERKFNSEELELISLNRSYFGDETFGIENASQHFFRKPSSQLSAGEAALLVGLIRAPSRLSPIKHPDRAMEMRNHVLDEMVGQGWLTLLDAEREKSLPLGVAKS